MSSNMFPKASQRFGTATAEEWSDDTSVIELTPEMIAVIERARPRYLASAEAIKATPEPEPEPQDDFPESGVVKVASRIT
jgi:hypothetical protein